MTLPCGVGFSGPSSDFCVIWCCCRGLLMSFFQEWSDLGFAEICAAPTRMKETSTRRSYYAPKPLNLHYIFGRIVASMGRKKEQHTLLLLSVAPQQWQPLRGLRCRCEKKHEGTRVRFSPFLSFTSAQTQPDPNQP